MLCAPKTCVCPPAVINREIKTHVQRVGGTDTPTLHFTTRGLQSFKASTQLIVAYAHAASSSDLQQVGVLGMLLRPPTLAVMARRG